MKTFTYGKYIECIHKLRLNAVLQLADEGTQYKLEVKETNRSEDKLIKSILENTEEVAKIINTFLQPREKIDKNQLIKYTNNYIIKKYNTKETNIIYKLNNKDVYFLIQHQPNIDNAIPFRILNYCIDIIQEWSKTKKTKSITRISYSCTNYYLYRRFKVEIIYKP